MELILKPATIDFRYRVVFKEPQFEIVKEGSWVLLLNKIIKNFGLRLNDIKFNNQAPSNDFIHFSKFYGPSFFNVFFGLEEVEAWLQVALEEAQAVELFGKLAQLFENNPIALQRITLQQHLSSDKDALAFLKSLNPNPPRRLEKYLRGTGVYYTLVISEHNLKIYITLVESLFIPGGLYLSIESEFSPNNYAPEQTFDIVKNYHEFILNELDLKIEGA